MLEVKAIRRFLKGTVNLCGKQARWGAVGLLLLCVGGTASAGSLSFVTGNDYKPLTDESLPGGGVVTKIVRAVYKEMGLTLDVTFLPWKRGYLATRFGHYAGTFPYIYTQTRARHFYYSEPVISVLLHIYVRADGGHYADSIAGLEGWTTCLPYGYANSAKLEKMVEARRVRRIRDKSLAACLRKLAAAEVDFVEINNFLIGEAIRDSGHVRAVFRRLPFVARRAGQHVIFPRGLPASRARRAAFDMEFSRLQAGGRIQAIVDAYLKDGSAGTDE